MKSVCLTKRTCVCVRKKESERETAMRASFNSADSSILQALQLFALLSGLQLMQVDFSSPHFLFLSLSPSVCVCVCVFGSCVN